jgi:ATP-dependent protease ClpP protease subunit
MEEQAMPVKKTEQKEGETIGEAVQLLRGEGAIRVLTVVGQIEGHYALPENQKATRYEQIIPQLIELEREESVRGVLLVLHTLGGDVEAGLAIAEMIASMQTPTVSLVLGGGHSIGVPLAVAARRSFIVPSATMTVHPVRVSGTVLGAPQSYRYLSEMQNRIVQFVVRHSHIERQRFVELMMCPDELATDLGSVLEGEEAVKEGLIDEVGGVAQALACLGQMK